MMGASPRAASPQLTHNQPAAVFFFPNSHSMLCCSPRLCAVLCLELEACAVTVWEFRTISGPKRQCVEQESVIRCCEFHPVFLPVAFRLHTRAHVPCAVWGPEGLRHPPPPMAYQPLQGAGGAALKLPCSPWRLQQGTPPPRPPPASSHRHPSCRRRRCRGCSVSGRQRSGSRTWPPRRMSSHRCPGTRSCSAGTCSRPASS